MKIEERSTAARIRDAAIECFATEGLSGTTARKVAALAGVSAGSVINHFGSMEGLREACDTHLIAVVRETKSAAMRSGPGFDVAAALRGSGYPQLMGYLARVLIDDSPTVAQLVDELVTDAEGYLHEAVESGMMKTSERERERAVILTMWNLGMLVMHHHMKRLTGFDLVAPEYEFDSAAVRYMATVMEIYSDGVFTAEFAENARASLASLAAPSATAPLPDETKGTSP